MKRSPIVVVTGADHIRGRFDADQSRPLVSTVMISLWASLLTRCCRFRVGRLNGGGLVGEGGP